MFIHVFVQIWKGSQISEEGAKYIPKNMADSAYFGKCECLSTAYIAVKPIEFGLLWTKNSMVAQKRSFNIFGIVKYLKYNSIL